MSRYRGIAAIAVSALLLTVGAPARARSEHVEVLNTCTSVIAPAGAREIVPGEVILKFKKSAGLESTRQSMKAGGIAAVARMIGPPGETGLQLVNLREGVTVERAVEQLRARDDVEFAEPNYVKQLLYTPKDPGFPNQWGLCNTGQDIKGTTGTPGADIDAARAWDIEKGYSHPVTVAVIDSGIGLFHPDTSSQLWTNPGEVPGDGIDNDGNGYVDDVNGFNWDGISQNIYYYYDGSTRVDMYRDFGTSAGTRAYAQSITGRGCDLTHVGIMLSKVNNPATDITVSIRTDLSGPDLASFTISPSEISGTPGEIYKRLSSSVTLQMDATYFLVFQTSGEDSANYYRIYDAQVSHLGGWPAYYFGQEYLWDGSTWSASSSDSFYFKTNPNACPLDEKGHGMTVAGVIAAREGNGQGGVGVSFGARLMGLRVYDTADVCQALYYAADNGARVINMSLGSTEFSAAEQDAVDYAYGKGAVLFAAAGNFGDGTLWYPAACEHVAGVGATDNKDEKAWFSVHNKSVDLTAPGLNVYAPGMFNTYNYGYGTSVASPHAAGLAALMLSAKPSLSPDQVETAMEKYAHDLGEPGRDDYFGYGRIDAFDTLRGIHAERNRNSTWYLAEGTTDWGFSDYITIENPNASDLTAKITYMPTGSTNVVQTVSLPPDSQTTVNPADKVGQRDFSTRIECKEEKSIAVDRTMYWTGTNAPCPEAHSSVGVVSPARTWYLPEGSSAWGFETWTLIQNPNAVEASLTLTYMTQDAGPKVVEKKIPAHSRATFNMGSDIGEHDSSTEVTSNVPVIAERSQYRNNRREGSCSIGASHPATDYFLAEGTTAWGFTTYVLLQNPNDSNSRVTITYMTPGGQVEQPALTMAPNSRRTIEVNGVPGLSNNDLSTHVHSDNPIVAERAMYWNGGPDGAEVCHDSIGLSSPHTDFYLPDGQSSGGWETWTLVQNPNRGAVTVQVTYLPENGGKSVTFTDEIPAGSRRTYSMVGGGNKYPGIQGRASVVARSMDGARPIVVERSMYRYDRGLGTSTIGAFKD